MIGKSIDQLSDTRPIDFPSWHQSINDQLIISKHSAPFLACVASVSVGFGSKERQRNGIFGVFPTGKMGWEPQNEREGWGRGTKEPLADKPLNFENLSDWLGLSNFIDMCRSNNLTSEAFKVVYKALISPHRTRVDSKSSSSQKEIYLPCDS